MSKTEKPRPLDKVAEELVEAHGKIAEFEPKLKATRLEFFAIAESEAKASTLAQKTVEIPEDIETADEARAWLEKTESRWRVVEFKAKDEKIIALLEERPEFVEKTYEHSGKVIEKKVYDGKPLLDDDRLKEEDPDLWERITYQPDDITPPRALKKSEEISKEDLAVMQDYMYSAPPTTKLLVKKVKNAPDQEN